MSRLDTITADELLGFLADDSFSASLSTTRIGDEWDQARETVSRLLPTVLPEMRVQSRWNIMQNVCRNVDNTLFFLPNDEVHTALNNPSVKEIRRRLGLRIAVRLRLANHTCFGDFIEFIKNNSRETGSLLANYAGRNPENGSAIKGLIYGIFRDYLTEGESPDVFWKVLTEYLTQESGVHVERVEMNGPENQKGYLQVSGMSN